MSITKKELRQIIKEEVLKELRRIDERESYIPQYTGVAYGARESKAEGLMDKIKADLKALQKIERGSAVSRFMKKSERSNYFDKIIKNGRGFEDLMCGLGGCKGAARPLDISDFWIGVYNPKGGNVYAVYAVWDMDDLPEEMRHPKPGGSTRPIDLKTFQKML